MSFVNVPRCIHGQLWHSCTTCPGRPRHSEKNPEKKATDKR